MSRCNCIKWGIVLRDYVKRVCGANATVYRRKRGQRRFSQKLDSEYGEKRPRGARSEAPLVHGEGSWLSMELLIHGAWPPRGYPLRRGTNED